MSDPNVSVIPEEYDALKLEYINLKKELDYTKQELYESKRNVQLLEDLQGHYQSEIEFLQTQSETNKKNLEEKLIRSEEFNSSLKLKLNDRINSLELDLLKHEEQNALLQNEIEILRKTNTSTSDVEVINKLNDEIFNLKGENLIILETAEELKISLECLQKQNSMLDATILVSMSQLNKLMYPISVYILGNSKRKR